MKTYKDEVFCDACGANLAMQYDKEIVEEQPGKEYVKRTMYLYCPNQNCPKQFKRVELPDA